MTYASPHEYRTRETPARPQPSSLGPGAMLNGTYRIERLLSEGGMGMVYLATHQRLGGQFVVKTLHPSLADTEAAQARLHKEAQVLASLNHPNIVKVLDFNRSETGMAYLVMELLDGRELKDVASTGELHPWDTAAVVREIAAALSAAHTRGVVHGDLKPENVIIMPVPGQCDSLKLIDFGVSNQCMSASIDAARVVLGTPSYMSPEQISGAGAAIDERSDEFSLAVLTFEMFSGELPFADPDDAGVLARILSEPPVRLAGRVPWNPSAVETVLRRALAKRRDDRFPTVEVFVRELETALRADIGGEPIPLRLATPTPTAPAPVPSPLPPRARHTTQRLHPRVPQLSAPLPSGSRGFGVVQARRARANPPRRPRRPLQWAVTLALATCVYLFPPERTASLVVAGRSMSGRIAQLVRQTIDKGVNKTAAQAGILKPRSSDSSSAQPFPP